MQDTMPHHGLPVRVQTPHGPRVIRCRIAQDELQALVNAYVSLSHVIGQHGTTVAAARAVGMKRRKASMYLKRLGLTGTDHLQAHVVTYTCEVTGKSVRTLYPWGTVHKAVRMCLREQLSTQEVGRRTGINGDTVHHWVHALGIARGAALQHRINAAQRHGFRDEVELSREVMRLHADEGCSTDDIAKALSMPKHLITSVVRRRLPRLKRDPRRTRQRTAEVRERFGKPAQAYKSGMGDRERRAQRRAMVAAMRAGGVDVIEIARRFDVSIATIYHDLKWLREREAAVAEAA